MKQVASRRLEIRLTDDQRERVEHMAEINGVSLSEVTILALEHLSRQMGLGPFETEKRAPGWPNDLMKGQERHEG